jgi:hypothetical protein
MSRVVLGVAMALGAGTALALGCERRLPVVVNRRGCAARRDGRAVADVREADVGRQRRRLRALE